jgi:hypothetical protein
MSQGRNRPQEVFVKRFIFAIAVAPVVAAAFGATTSATSPARSAMFSALDSSRTQEAETSVSDVLLQTGA